ncbi:hypothetical protein L207DRAFT_274735 [Hyaloscypha variabilis F]|uniref:Uncharacterized protein n=1 Tax=Hyaloscypha variabilis (strain UAMH 11265 / GT02V1 / F) TaxID=1149755 RepID=A0A2J6S093_HYAVF|nr:hypothetical protein L207DRAFT_274735 [Hyaloscypha variabilis F]
MTGRLCSRFVSRKSLRKINCLFSSSSSLICADGAVRLSQNLQQRTGGKHLCFIFATKPIFAAKWLSRIVH